MPGRPNRKPRSRCKGFRRDGEPCTDRSVRFGEFCEWHFEQEGHRHFREYSDEAPMTARRLRVPIVGKSMDELSGEELFGLALFLRATVPDLTVERKVVAA